MFLVAISLILLVAVHCELQDVTTTSQAPEKKVIYLLTLLPYYKPKLKPALNPSWDAGADIQPVMDLAKDQINNDSSLLENYSLELVHADGACNLFAITAQSFVEEAFNPERAEKLAGIIGPGCSVSTISLSQLTNRSELGLVMVHSAGSPTLANSTEYQYLLGILGSTENFVKGFKHLLTVTRWKRIGVLYDDSRLFYLNTKRLFIKELPESVNVEFLSPVSFTFIPLEAVKEQQLRVVFILCPIELSRRILCLSYNNSQIYSNYQLVFVSQILEHLLEPTEFEYDGVSYSCSKDNMATALEMTFLLRYNLNTSDESLLVSNTSYSDYLRDYEKYREVYNTRSTRDRDSVYTYWATIFYDAVWAWALVLDNLTKTDSNFEVNIGGYGNLNQTEKIVEQFYRTSFYGASGEISFDRHTTFTEHSTDLIQVRSGSAIRLASIGEDMILNHSTEFEFISDSFPLINIRENPILAGFFTFIEALQLFVVVILQIFSVVYRNRASIKASSPKLLHMSYAGVYLVVAGVLIFTCRFAIPSNNIEWHHYFCQLLWGWCLPIGFILSFGPVAMRTWRIYRIFKHYLNPGPLISNPVLFAGTGLLLSVVVVMAIIWIAIDPFQTIHLKIEVEDEMGTIIVHVISFCDCTYYFYWLGIFMSYLVGVLIVVTIFSLLTRNIGNPSFTTTALRVLSYIMTLLFLLGFPLYYLVNFLHPSNLDHSFAVLGVLMNLMLAVFILCVFVPPLLPVLRTLRKKVRKISLASMQTLVT